MTKSITDKNPSDIQLNLDWIRENPIELKIGNDIDYYALFYAIKSQYRSCYLFESLALTRHQDRYYTIGFDPAVEFIANGDTLTIIGQRNIVQMLTGTNDKRFTISGINPFEFIKNNIPLKFQSKPHYGGLIGYFSYEAANYFEPSLDLTEPDDFSMFHLGLYLDGVVYDSTTGIMSYYSFFEDRSDLVNKLTKTIDNSAIPSSVEKIVYHGNNLTKDQHREVVNKTLKEIKSGNTLQGEVGMRTDYVISGDKIAVYSKLREINPSPYMYYVVFGDEELLGASPEILVASSGGYILTTPTAGTLPRGSDKADDMRLTRDLLESEKNLAEHRMLIDIHRNDIARVSNIGSVRVSDLTYVIKFSHVQHIVSDIVGSLAKDRDAYDLLSSIMPGGVVTGAPKIETMKIISRNESLPRGPYGGAVGRFSMNGDMVFCLPIRSLFCKGDACYSQTCSGIVFDSNPDDEYQEIIDKLAAMSQTIHEAGGKAL